MHTFKISECHSHSSWMWCIPLQYFKRKRLYRGNPLCEANICQKKVFPLRSGLYLLWSLLTGSQFPIYSFPFNFCQRRLIPPVPPENNVITTLHIKKNLQPFPSAINNERSITFYLHIFSLVGLCIFASTQIHQGHAPCGTIFCSATFEGLAAGPCQHYHTGVQVEQGGVSPPITTNKYVGM